MALRKHPIKELSVKESFGLIVNRGKPSLDMIKYDFIISNNYG
jgi:hypothetical protein